MNNGKSPSNVDVHRCIKSAFETLVTNEAKTTEKYSNFIDFICEIKIAYDNQRRLQMTK